MDSLQRFGWLAIRPPLQQQPFSSVSWKPVFIQQSSLRPVRSEIGEKDDVLEAFLRERQSNGDLISRVSDVLWQRNALSDQAALSQSSSYVSEQDEVDDDDDDGGFLKLSTTQEWLLGDKSAPRNRKDIAKALEDDRERWRRVNLLEYDADLLLQIKRELRVLCVGIGSVCTLYCVLALSLQAAASYAVGVGFSCVYLELLYTHVDTVSRDQVPQIFRQRKSAKNIGIRSEDLRVGLERTIKGSAMALSSPRLLIPAAIYAVWAVTRTTALFHLEIAPALLGMFVYKAAALVQVYRDNQDLQFVFPADDSNQDLS